MLPEIAVVVAGVLFAGLVWRMGEAFTRRLKTWHRRRNWSVVIPD